MNDKLSQSPEADLPSFKARNPISHSVVIQRVLELFPNPTYLEIGVQKGHTFNLVQADQKVGVDPKFSFDAEAVAAKVPGASLHETTSDHYFGRIATASTSFDVIFLDGLHTSEQTIRDLINAMAFLKPQGVIIVDDVFPSSYSASLHNVAEMRAMRGATGEKSGAWMGDVYRLIFFVETFCQQFSYCMVNNNHGQLVMWREPRRKVPQRTLSQVAEKEYKDLFLERSSLRCASLEVILEKIQAARG